MKKKALPFISAVCLYKKGILLSSKFAFALLLAAMVQFSAYGTPLTRHNQANKNKNLPQKALLSSTRSQLSDITVKGKGNETAKAETIIGATIGIKNGKSLAVTASVNGTFQRIRTRQCHTNHIIYWLPDPRKYRLVAEPKLSYHAKRTGR